VSDFANLTRRDAFADTPDAVLPELRIQTLQGYGIVHLAARKQRATELEQYALHLWGSALPRDPRAVTCAGGTTLCAIGPGSWWVFQEGAPADWHSAIASRLSSCAAAVDQTGAFGVLRLEGPRTREVLASGIFVDFDPSRFPVGRVVATGLSHFNVILWRLQGDSAFQLAVPRSVATDLWHWLQESGARVRGHATDAMPVWPQVRTERQ